MEKYTYNYEIIEKLNIKKFIEQYNFTNEKYNNAIFCALSSLYEHYKEKNLETKSILMGDYYSFEYYSLLQDELEKLSKLTIVMKNGYLNLINNNMDFKSFFFEILATWFYFYEKDLEQIDISLIGDISL